MIKAIIYLSFSSALVFGFHLVAMQGCIQSCQTSIEFLLDWNFSLCIGFAMVQRLTILHNFILDRESVFRICACSNFALGALEVCDG